MITDGMGYVGTGVSEPRPYDKKSVRIKAIHCSAI